MPSSSSKTLLIGWDAAEWKVIRPLIEQGLMPNFRRVMDGGIAGAIHAGHPLLSPTLWTTLVTGRHPTRHGVLGGVELGKGAARFRAIGRGACKSPPIWSVLDRHRIASHSINFPATHPAEHLHGVSVSNLFAFDAKAKDSVWPPEYREPLEALRVRASEIDAASLLTFVPKAREVDPKKNARIKQIAGILAHTATVHAATTWALENVPWEFAAVCYTGLHQFSHGFMRYCAPRMAEVSEGDFEIFGGVVTAAYRFHDMMLGRLLELAGERANVLLMSDHGFRTGNLRPAPAPASENAMLAWHRPVGVCVMSGPGVKPDSGFRHFNILEIAPIVLNFYGKSFSEDLPVAKVESAQESEQSVEYLRELGYAELPDIHAEFDARQLERRRQYYLAVAMLDARHPRQAIPILVELLRQDRGNLECRIALAHAYADARQTVECRKLVDQFLSENPTSAAALAGLGMLELAARRAEAAIERFKKAQEVGALSAPLLADIGRGYLRLRMFAEAKRAFEDALALDEELYGAYGGMARAMLGEGDAGGAADAARRAILLSPLQAELHYVLALALLQLDQLAEAQAALKESVRIDPEFVPALHKLAHLCQRRGQITLAADYDRRAHLAAARRRIADFQEGYTAQSFRE